MKYIALILALFAATPVFCNEKTPEVTAGEKFQEVVISFLEKTNDLGGKIADNAEKAVNFAAEEIPVVIQEYLRCHFTASLAWCILSTIVLSLATWAFYVNVVKTWKLKWEDTYSTTEVGVIAIITIIASLISFIIFPCVIGHNLEWLKIAVAPRVFLIHQAGRF
jgi:hypothetical protein